MTNKAYDIIKIIAQIVLPACGALYASLAGIWNWPFAEAVVGSISAVDLFLGALLKVKSTAYWQDKEVIDHGQDDN